MCPATATPPPCGCEIEDILVREFGGTRLEFTARVSESPWALMHFMVRLPSETKLQPPPRSTSRRQQDPDPGVAERSRANLGGPADRRRRRPFRGASGTPTPSITPAPFPRSTNRPSPRPTPSSDIAIIEGLTDDSVKLVFSERDEQTGERCGPADLVSGWTHRLAEPAAADAAEHGRRRARGATVHGHPAGRAAGVDLPVQNPAASDHPDGVDEAERDSTAQRFADAVTAIWQGRVEIDRFNELVMRARLTWQQVVLLRAYAKVLAAGGLSLQPVLHRIGAQRPSRYRAVTGHIVRSALRPQGNRVHRPVATRKRPPPRSPRISTRW